MGWHLTQPTSVLCELSAGEAALLHKPVLLESILLINQADDLLLIWQIASFLQSDAVG